MSETTPQPTLEVLKAIDWESVVSGSHEHTCLAYSHHFFRRAGELNEDQNIQGMEALLILAHCTGLRLRPANRHHPFEVVFVSRTAGKSVLEDLDSYELELLRQLASATTDPELRARFADIAWVLKRNYQSAAVAIQAYVESGDRLDKDGDWIEARDRLERALRLAAQLGRGGRELYERVLGDIERKINEIDEHDRNRDLQPAHLMRLLLEFRAGDALNLYSLARRKAERGESIQGLGWEMARDYWLLAADWAELLEDQESAHSCNEHAAECLVRIADEFASAQTPNHISVSIQLQKAVEAFRQIGEIGKAQVIHRRLLEHQVLALNQMRSSEYQLDIEETMLRAETAVKGKDFHQAAIVLACIAPIRTVESLRIAASEISDDELFVSLIASKERVDGRGKVVGRYPSTKPGDLNSRELALEASMFDLANRFHEIAVAALIEPARRQIALEHRTTFNDILELLRFSPFVPPRREIIAAKGLLAGFQGDFIVSSHLLVPQFENSLRELLDRHGVITNNLTSDGQEDFNLAKLLSLSETQVLLGEDLVFDLRGLLVEPLGSNWRNIQAHGLANQDDLHSAASRYTWWAMLKLALLPHFSFHVGEQNASEERDSKPA